MAIYRTAKAATAADPTAASMSTPAPAKAPAVTWFEPFVSSNYSTVERAALLAVLVIAVIGLLYAGMLVGQVKKADEGTQRMKDIAAAVREGANAYLKAQFTRIIPLILIITVLLFFSVMRSRLCRRSCYCLLYGAMFSSMVGFVGMRLATNR